MFNIVYTEEVKEDLKEIRDYISKDNLIYAIKTIQSIIKTIDTLKTFPKMGKEIKFGYRLIVENTYKYNIVYKVEDNVFIFYEYINIKIVGNKKYFSKYNLIF